MKDVAEFSAIARPRWDEGKWLCKRGLLQGTPRCFKFYDAGSAIARPRWDERREVGIRQTPLGRKTRGPHSPDPAGAKDAGSAFARPRWEVD